MKKDKRPKIGIVVGSNRPGRVCLSVAEWVMQEMDDRLDLSLIDLAEIALPFLDEPVIPAKHRYQNPHTKAWSALIGGYDGFVLVFPQYNWGYPAVLKNALDTLYDEWAGKPVSILCYGSHGGFQGTLAMSLVTRGLHMHNMATNPPLDIDEHMFDRNGQFKDIDRAFGSVKGALRALSDEFADLLGSR